MQQQAVLLACSTESHVTAWDLNTATQLTQYKTNSSGRNRLCRLGSDYVAAAQNSKDVIHFWTWHKDQVLQRCFTQEQMTALAASPSGAYIVGGGVSGTLYCWETASGQLLRSWPAHYKAVSCLAFSDSGGVLVSGGEDTLVAAWLLAEVLDAHRDGPIAAAAAAVGIARVEPLHTWSEHTLPVTCLHLGWGEGSALLATGSLDRAVKLWSLATGQHLRTITLPAGITAITLDAGEHVLLAGCVDGSIWEASLTGQPIAAAGAGAAGSRTSASAAVGGDDAAAAATCVIGGPGSCCYEGHTKAISSLAITPDGEQLVSGSEDGTARVWDMRSRQCLRVISSPGKAPVSAALLVGWPAHLTHAGARQAPKRMQPLATLAKYAGAATTAKPWEGPAVILDGGLRSSSSTGITAAAGLLPEPYASPLDLFLKAPAAAIDAGTVLPGAQSVARSSSSPGAGHTIQRVQDAAGQVADEVMQVDAAVTGQGQDVGQLQQVVQELQQQLQASRQLAQQWQALHRELHQFCTEKVLASAPDS